MTRRPTQRAHAKRPASASPASTTPRDAAKTRQSRGAPDAVAELPIAKPRTELLPAPPVPPLVRRRRAEPRFLKAPRTPTHTHLESLYRELIDGTNIVGCFVGFKFRGGRQTRDVSLVCCVREKRPTREVRKGERVPPLIRWGRTPGSKRELPTDVVELGPSGHLGAAPPVLGPGDLVVQTQYPGGATLPERGTVGAAMRHPEYGVVVTTAAHVVAPNSPGVHVYAPDYRPLVTLANAGPAGQPRTFHGHAVKVSMTAETDYALITPTDAQVANWYGDSHQLAPPYTPSAADVGARLAVITPTRITPVQLAFVNGAAPIAGFPMQHLLCTDYQTYPGDSGACLVDQHSRIWGFVEGFTTINGRVYSVFTAAHLAFFYEGARFL